MNKKPHAYFITVNIHQNFSKNIQIKYLHRWNTTDRTHQTGSSIRKFLDDSVDKVDTI